MHPTLVRQLRRATGLAPEEVVSPWKELLEAVERTYTDFDEDRALIERSLEVSSSELRALIALLQATLEATNEGVLVVDGKDKVANYNQRFVDIWQVEKEVLALRDPLKILEAVVDMVNDPHALRENVEYAFAHPNESTHILISFKDGRHVELSSKPQFIDNKGAGRVWSSRDITERVQAEIELKTKLATLERLNRAMVDRELKMVELKDRIKEMERTLEGKS